MGKYDFFHESGKNLSINLFFIVQNEIVWNCTVWMKYNKIFQPVTTTSRIMCQRIKVKALVN